MATPSHAKMATDPNPDSWSKLISWLSQWGGYGFAAGGFMGAIGAKLHERFSDDGFTKKLRKGLAKIQEEDALQEVIARQIQRHDSQERCD